MWIHGGGNTAGSMSNPTYNGCNLATDSVVVSVNYRLGPLGFLALESFGIGGNFGIQDQLLALSWVKTHIQAFGGDPVGRAIELGTWTNNTQSKIVLFGQSAGALDVYVIASLPQAPSLIRGAIAQSGGGAGLPSKAAVDVFATKYAASLNCDDVGCSYSFLAISKNLRLLASDRYRFHS